MRERERGYILEEEKKKSKKKKNELESGMVEFFVETTSITASTGGLNIGVENLTGSVSLPAGGLEKLNSLDVSKFESVRKTAEYGRIYNEGLLRADDYINKDKEKTEKRIKEIREQIERRKKNIPPSLL